MLQAFLKNPTGKYGHETPVNKHLWGVRYTTYRISPTYLQPTPSSEWEDLNYKEAGIWFQKINKFRASLCTYLAECDNVRKCILVMMRITYGERLEWSNSRGNSSPMQNRGTMTCLIISALRCWNSGCVAQLSPPRLGAFPVQRPSPATLYGRRKKTEKGLKCPAASYQRQNRRL